MQKRGSNLAADSLTVVLFQEISEVSNSIVNSVLFQYKRPGAGQDTELSYFHILYLLIFTTVKALSECYFVYPVHDNNPDNSQKWTGHGRD